MIGEKFTEQIVDGNKITRIYEFKEFSHKYYDIVAWAEDTITDDPEELYGMGVCLSYEDFYSLDCEEFRHKLTELREEWSESPEDYPMEKMNEYIALLEEAVGFTIFFDRTIGRYKSYGL